MIEKYITDEGVKVTKVTDNGTSITFECAVPDDNKVTTLTLSDLGIARAIGIEPKNYTREEFVKAISDTFPIVYGRYFIPDSEFPIPVEWEEAAKENVKNALSTKMFFAIDAPYIQGIEPPLYGICLLKAVRDQYDSLPSKDSFCPSDLNNLVSNPELLFEEKITRMEG